MWIYNDVRLSNRSARRIVEDARAPRIAGAGEDRIVFGRVGNGNQADSIAPRRRTNRLRVGLCFNKLDISNAGPTRHCPTHSTQNVTPKFDLGAWVSQRAG